MALPPAVRAGEGTDLRKTKQKGNFCQGQGGVVDVLSGQFASDFHHQGFETGAFFAQVAIEISDRSIHGVRNRGLRGGALTEAIENGGLDPVSNVIAR